MNTLLSAGEATVSHLLNNCHLSDLVDHDSRSSSWSLQSSGDGGGADINPINTQVNISCQHETVLLRRSTGYSGSIRFLIYSREPGKASQRLIWKRNREPIVAGTQKAKRRGQREAEVRFQRASISVFNHLLVLSSNHHDQI